MENSVNKLKVYKLIVLVKRLSRE